MLRQESPLGIVYLFKPRNIYNSITPKQVNQIDVGAELPLSILRCSEPESCDVPKVTPDAPSTNIYDRDEWPKVLDAAIPRSRPRDYLHQVRHSLTWSGKVKRAPRPPLTIVWWNGDDVLVSSRWST